MKYSMASYFINNTMFENKTIVYSKNCHYIYTNDNKNNAIQKFALKSGMQYYICSKKCHNYIQMITKIAEYKHLHWSQARKINM